MYNIPYFCMAEKTSIHAAMEWDAAGGRRHTWSWSRCTTRKGSLAPLFSMDKRNARPCANRLWTLQWRKGAFTMTLRVELRKSTVFAAFALLAAMALTALGASPARADRCDDLAGQLKNQIDGISVGKTAANLIYLSHPRAKEITLGCAGRTYANQLFAKSEGRKPTPDFLDLVASASAIIFTLPKDDMLRGATRCIKRMGLIHGDNVSTRYRRLDMNCSRTRTDASITISRGTDE